MPWAFWCQPFRLKSGQPVTPDIFGILHQAQVSAGGSPGRDVMIPELNDHGYLPAGVHAASVEEVAARFGQDPELRRVQMESLRWLVDLARRAGIDRLVIDGSF